MAMKRDEIETMIRAAFPDATIEVTDLAGDGGQLLVDVLAAADAAEEELRALPGVDQLRRGRGHSDQGGAGGVDAVDHRQHTLVAVDADAVFRRDAGAHEVAEGG